jgi:hypothetical protein
MAAASAAAKNFGGRVHAAVAAGESAERVRRAIDECARPGDEQGRALAVNEAGEGDEFPLVAAGRLRRGDLVGLLLEEGADAGEVWGQFDPKPTTALVRFYGQVDSLRALMRKGYDVNPRLKYYHCHSATRGRTLAHACVAPCTRRLPPAPPQLACLEAFVREGNADLNARDDRGQTPLHWLVILEANVAAAVDLLVRLGADVNAGDKWGATPLLCAQSGATSRCCGGCLTTAPRPTWRT